MREAGTLEAVAAKVGSTSVYLSQIRNQATDKSTGRPREMGASMARRLEQAHSKDSGWMDVDHTAPHRPGVAPPPLPNQRFDDRHEVSESDFGLLQAVHMIMTDEEKANLRKRAEHALAVAMEQIGGLGRKPD